MNLNRTADKIRSRLPRPIWNLIRKTGNAVLGPLNFSFETGHFRSAFKSYAVDRLGNALPWFTYPAIQFLLTKDFREKRILEWGGGQSTQFWAQRGREVITFEADPVWFETLKRKLPGNAQLFFVDESLSKLDPQLLQGLFDVIIVDGLDRFKCAEVSLGRLAQDGVIIVDNAEGNHGAEKGCGIIDLYSNAGLSRIDFIGFAPGLSVQHCTSFFYRGSCFLVHTKAVPQIISISDVLPNKAWRTDSPR